MIKFFHKVKVINNFYKKDISSSEQKRNSNLTRIELMVLGFISNKKENVTPKDIQKEFSISKSTCSEIISSLEKKQIVTKVVHETDSRNIFIKLSEKGTNLNKEFMKLFRRLDQEMLSCLSDDEAKELERLLDKVIDSAYERKKGDVNEEKR